MNTAVNANVVHESEAQRQHARVKIPAKLRFFGPDRTPLEARVLDLSAGGLAFNAGQLPLTIGQVYKARLQFVIDNLGIWPWTLNCKCAPSTARPAAPVASSRTSSRRIFPPCAT